MTLEQIKRLGEDKARIIYNNIMATHNLVNIQQAKGKDFDIVDTDKYCYMMTYSFPCQDLSSAGLGKGMEKGSGTRSGMLWEVERILDELKNGNMEMPQVLVMENVPEVIGTNNIKHFAKWLEKLESLGYKNKWEVLNAKEFGVPQNRERCFMVSILGDYYYHFPKTQQLKLRLKDLLEDNVDEKFYLSDSKIQTISNWKAQQDPLKDIDKEKTVSPCLTARGAGEEHIGMILINEEVYKDNLKTKLCNNLINSGILEEEYVVNHSYTNGLNGKNPNSRHEPQDYIETTNGTMPTLTTRPDILGVVVNDTPKVVGGIGEKKSNGGTQWYQQDRIYDENVAISVTTSFNPYYAIKSKNKRLHNLVENMDLTKDNQFLDIYNQTTNENAGTITTRVDASNSTAVYKNLRIRKLTPKECFRFMGVKDEDFEKIAENQSNASLYHLAGDSIVVNVLMAIFKEMLW